VLAAIERRVGGGRAVIGGSYVRPWEDGAVAAIPVLERPPIATLAECQAQPSGLRAS
jgi:hypothetical protein